MNIKAEVFNEHFTQAVGKLIDSLPSFALFPASFLSSDNSTSVFSLILSRNNINSLISSKTSDAHDLSTEVIKSVKETIILPFTEIIMSNSFPGGLKIAKVLHLLKKGVDVKLLKKY